MNLKPYPKYKDSGIEWLGEVPEGWEVKKLKYVAHVEMGQSPESDFYNKDGNGVPFLQGNADFKEIYPQPQVWTIEGNKYSKKDDILISVRAPVGEINISDNRYAIGRGLVALRFCEKFNFKFYYYLFNKAKNYFDSVSTGTTYTSVSTDDIKNISVVVPPKEHQITIATFLDQKTAKIDKLIKKNETLVELLKEKRQASISHAVTKGLAPNAKMKDSGIEWIGEIPEGWEVKRLKHLAGNDISAVQTGPFGAQLHASDYIDEGVPLILIRNVNNLWIDDSNIPKISEEKATSLSMYRLQEGDIIFSRVGSIGRIALVTKREEGWLISGQMLRIRISNPKLNNHFLLYVADSNLVSEFIEFKSVGSTRDSINTDILRNVCIPLPSLLEQKAIIQYIETTTANIDSLIQKILSQIAVLKEYRQALISNVVTGKVRVYDCNLQGKRIK